MGNNRLIEIYNLIQEELEESPEDEVLSDDEIDMYADLQNLKESLTDYFAKLVIKNKEHFEYKEITLIGLNKYLYTFSDKKNFDIAYKELGKIGTVSEVFVNNEYALEFKENTRILDENKKFSEKSMQDIEEHLDKCYGVRTTISYINEEHEEELP